MECRLTSLVHDLKTFHERAFVADAFGGDIETATDELVQIVKHASNTFLVLRDQDATDDDDDDPPPPSYKQDEEPDSPDDILRLDDEPIA